MPLPASLKCSRAVGSGPGRRISRHQDVVAGGRFASNALSRSVYAATWKSTVVVGAPGVPL